jgi:hypothetical protein
VKPFVMFLAILKRKPLMHSVCPNSPDKGDLYGGAHYMQSSSADLTPQGRAIRDASRRFGDGETLPFTPCKKGYIPLVDGKPMFACFLHDKARRERHCREKLTFRNGEVDLSQFWSRKALSNVDEAECSQLSSQCCLLVLNEMPGASMTKNHSSADDEKRPADKDDQLLRNADAR